MTLARLRLGIAGGGASDFATTPVASLEIKFTPGNDVLSVRSEINPVRNLSRGNWGTLARATTAYATKYRWEVNAVLTVAEKERLEDLVDWDRGNIATGLRLIDEYEAVPPRVSATKVLLSGTRFGVFPVAVTIDEISRFAHYQNGRFLCAITMEEL